LGEIGSNVAAFDRNRAATEMRPLALQKHNYEFREDAYLVSCRFSLGPRVRFQGLAGGSRGTFEHAEMDRYNH
jgi:hypothetical protein